MKYQIQHNIGNSKYVVNFSDGTKTHSDGSEFWDCRIFSNHRKMQQFIKSLGGIEVASKSSQPSELKVCALCGGLWLRPVGNPSLNCTQCLKQIEKTKEAAKL